jgi:hypothetical protein
MLQADKSVRVIAKAIGKTRDCIRKKIARLGLVVVVPVCRKKRTTTSLVLPAELPSVEDALRKLAGIHDGTGNDRHLKNRDNAAANSHSNQRLVPA